MSLPLVRNPGYGFKQNVSKLYELEYGRIKRPGKGEPSPLRIYMSSVSDPYQPQEKKLQFTRALLAAMQTKPPDVLVIQTRSPLVGRDIDLIKSLAEKCELWLSMTVETDMDRIPGLPPHATPIKRRIETLRRFKAAGVPTQAAVSPLCPILDVEGLAHTLQEASDRVVIDHWQKGDGTNGCRTSRTRFPRVLEEAGYGAWNSEDKLEEVKAVFDRVFGQDRVRVSTAGFNAVGEKANAAPPPAKARAVPVPTRGPTPSHALAAPSENPPSGRSVVEPTDRALGAFLARLPGARESLEEKQRLLRDQVLGVAKAYSTGLYLHGPAGHGKTHAVVGLLASRKAAFEHHKGHVTPGGLIDTLGERPDAIHVYDDVSEILKHKVALQVLLAALGRPAGVKESDPDAFLRRVKYKRQGRERVLDFTGGVIALSNLPLPKNEVAGAFASRIDVMNYRLSDEEAAALMLDIAAKGHRDQRGRSLPPEACREVAEFVIAESIKAERPFDLRDLTHKGLPKRLQHDNGDAECHWHQLLRAALRQRFDASPTAPDLPDSPKLLAKDQLVEIAAEIAATNDRGEGARLAEWAARTGRGGRTYYRYLGKAKGQG